MNESDRLARMFAQAPSIMVMFRGPDHVFEFANQAALRFLDNRDIVGKPLREALPDLEGQGFSELLDEVNRSGKPFIGKGMKASFQHQPDGPREERFLDFIYQPVTNDDGSVAGIFVQATDVTDRVRAESLRAAHNRVMELAIQDTPLEQSLEALIRTVEEHSSSGIMGSILLLDEDGRHLRHGAGPSLPQAYNDAIEGIAIGPNVGSCGTAAHRKRPVYVRDIATDPLWKDFRDLAIGHGLHSCWSTPILSPAGNVLGTFAFYYSEPIEPTLDDLELVSFVTHSATAIIEKKRGDRALQQSEEQLRLVLDAAPGAFYSVDREGNTTLVSRGFLELLGFADESEALGRKLHDVIHHTHPDGSPYPVEECAIYRCASTGVPAHIPEELFFRLDGSPVPVEYWVSPIMRGEEHVGAICTILDLTQRKAAEETLRIKAAEFEALAENVSQLAWMAEPDGSIFWYNKRWYDYTGTDVEAMRDWGWRDVHHPDHIDRVIEEVTGRWAAGETWEGTYLLRSASGEYRWFLTRAEPIRDEKGALVRWFGTNTDITAQLEAEQALAALNETLELRVEEEVARRTEAEEALRQSQKMEAIGQLTGGIAHDFNNLLQIISGNLDILRRSIPADSPRLHRSVDNAFKGAERAAVLTQRLLAFSRRQPLDPKVIDPNKLVSGMSEMLQRTLGETIELETVHASGLWRVEADPNQLENALLNLAINSRDSMPDGGKLTIETANTHLDRDYARRNGGVTAGQYVLICVSDTGLGMDEATADRAVDPFFTTKEVGKGTGLGLSMVYGFVKQSGGHLKIYSEPCEGTTVKIYLPRHHGTEAAAAEIMDDDLAPERSDGETILVCEDDDDVRAYSVESLRELGYRVIEAADGEAALRLIASEKGRVDLLFTDIVLPGGMTGAILAERAMRVQRGLKVLFTTGYARNAIVHHGRLDTGVELLSKPFAYAELAARIRDLLDGR